MAKITTLKSKDVSLDPDAMTLTITIPAREVRVTGVVVDDLIVVAGGEPDRSISPAAILQSLVNEYGIDSPSGVFAWIYDQGWFKDETDWEISVELEREMG